MEEATAFQETFSRVLQDKVLEIRAVPQTSAERPGRLFCQAERRLGLLPGQRRRLTVSGIKPVGPVHCQCETFSLDGAVEPTTGERFFLELPPLNTVTLQSLMHAFAPQYQETLHMVLRNHGSCQKAQALVLPDHLVGLFLPPHRPARNPSERLGQALQEPLAWHLVAPLAAWERHVETLIRH